MFVRSFKNFKKKISNFKFELVEYRSKDELILENKEQALSILSKKNIREDNPTFILFTDLINKIFKNLNYLGLITKFLYEQEVSIQELKDLLPWLKQSGGKLPQNPLSYKKFEDLKDDIIKTDNKQRVKTIYNKLPREQKNLITDKPLFFEKALSLHKLGMVKEFGRKLSLQKTEEDLIAYMDDFIEKNSESITFGDITTKLRSLNSEILIEDPDTGIVMAEILDYKTSKSIGSSDWCIVTGEGSWNSYTRGTRRQFFMWDFSENRTSASFLIGFTSNSIGQITNIHDKYDISLAGNVPQKIKEVLKEINISTDPFEFKNDILIKVGSGLGTKIPYENDNDNEDVIIIQTEKEGYGSFRSETWGSYNPFPYGDEKLEFYFYVVYNFNYPMNDARFCYAIESSDDGTMKLIEVMDNTESNSYLKITDGKISGMTSNNEFIVNLYRNGYIKTKSIEDIYEEKKSDYLNKIEKFVKGTVDISSSYEDKKSKYINTSDDPGSTGDYWLFKIEHDELKEFSTSIIDTWDPMYNKSIVNFNLYVLVKLDESFRSPDFIRFIKLGENDMVIKYNLKKDSKFDTEVLPDDIQKFMSEGFMKIKTQKEYQKEISRKRKQIFEKSNDAYNGDSRVEQYGEALFHYLVEEGDIDEDDYDEDDEEAYKKILLPQGENYDLLSFKIYTYDMLVSSWGGGSEWMLGDDDEADSAAEQYQENTLEEIGIEGLPDWILNDHIDSDRFGEDYGDDSDYYNDEVRDRPEDYGLEREMSEENEEKLEEAIEERDEKEEEITETKALADKVYARTEKYVEFVESKLEKIEELQSELDTDDDYDRKYNRLEVIKDKLEKRSEINKERYEDLYTNLMSKSDDLQEEFEELETLVDEMEDEDNEDYWEYNESEIEDKIDQLNTERKEEASDDPIQYLKDHGMDVTENIKHYVDMDGLAKSIIESDGRANGMSGYDGEEREFSYNDEYYYIYRTN